ncbi:MAG: T9SS type A sorting domain-containing protein [Bacteroidetes bacterium]|nr:T9SS type A sorting domain-containing protein [Bacteroidota bacterium]
MNLKKIVVTLLLGVLPLISSASHISGGEITWRCNGNGQFIFQVRLYRDCNGVAAFQNISLTTDAPIASINCQLISQNDLSPQGAGCPTCPVPLGFYNAVEEYVYESAPITLNGTPPPTGWLFYFNYCCRNQLITNLTNTSDFTYRSIMYPISGQSTSPCFDNSPYFAEPPTIGICTRDSVNLSFAAFDKDLDSLKYEFAHPIEFSSFGGNTPFSSGYTFTSPTPGLLQNPLNAPSLLNNTNGHLSLTSFTPGFFVITVQVTSYRCGQIISKVFREYTLMIFSNCFLTTTPTFTYNTSPDIFPLPYTETIYITVGDTLNYNFNATENELLPAAAGGNPQTMTMSASSIALGLGDTSYTLGCEIPPCAVLSSPTPFSSTAFIFEGLTWPTDCHHLGFNNGCLQHTRNYQFAFQVKDNYCPVPGVSSKSVLVKVKGPTIYTAGNSLAVSFPGITVQWYLNGTPIIGATDTLYTPTQSGTYSLIASTTNGCTLLSNSMYVGFAGIDNLNDQESIIKVFPNPSTGKSILNVFLNNIPIGTNLIHVIDVNGKVVKQIPIVVFTSNEHLLIDLSDLAAGVYSINISGKGKIFQTQLLLTN